MMMMMMVTMTKMFYF